MTLGLVVLTAILFIGMALALIVGPTFAFAIWGQKYAWPCSYCKNSACFYKCNKAYIEENWG